LRTARVQELPPPQVGRPLMQGVTAISAGFLSSDADRRAIQIGEFFLLQMSAFNAQDEKTPPEFDRTEEISGCDRADVIGRFSPC